jgi:hypothetical protein
LNDPDKTRREQITGYLFEQELVFSRGEDKRSVLICQGRFIAEAVSKEAAIREWQGAEA